MELRLFVYGTLKPGQARYRNYSDNVVKTCAAIAEGQLFALPAGYPAMVLGEGWVHGFILLFRDPSILDKLDEYEDYLPGRDPDQNLYERQLVETFDSTGQSFGSAWAYLMTPQRVYQMGGALLPDGHWG